MSILLTQITYTKSENISSNNYENITDSESISVNIGSEGKNNNLRITLKNPPIDIFSDGTVRYKWIDSTQNVIFKAVKAAKGQVINEELIEVYVKYEDLDPTLDVYSEDYLLFSGIINKGKITSDEGNNKIELTCLDRSSVMMDKLVVPTAIKQSDGKNSPLIIQQTIRLAADGVPSSSLAYDAFGNQLQGYPFYVDARLFSESILSTGTADSTGTRELNDSGATFSTDGVSVGDWVRNTTDETYAYILSVTETKLTLTKDIFISGEGYQVSDGFIQDTRVDGTAFPTISFSFFDKPVNDSMSKLSSTENINSASELSSTLVMERNMRWYVDKKNRFHWYYPDDTPNYIFKVGQREAISPDTSYHRIRKVELDNEVRGKVNYIIYKAGTNIDNTMIKGFSRAKFSGIPVIKESFRSWLTIAEEMKNSDEKAGYISRNTDRSYTVDEGYPFTPTWQSDGTTVADLAEYKADFIVEAKRRANAYAHSEFAKLSNPRWAGQILIRGEDISVGDLIEFTSIEHGIKNILMRINQVTHSISAEQGWQTTLNVEEDELKYKVIV